MPKGARPGERRGGRTKGIPNKATVERAYRAEREMNEAAASGRKLAKDVLDEFMHLFAGMAATYQPTPPNGPVNANENADKFDKYAILAVDTAHKLASYQSPKLQAIMVGPPPDANPQRKRFTLTIFEGAKPMLEIEPPPRASRGGGS